VWQRHSIKKGRKFVCDQSQQNKNYSLAIIKKKGQNKKKKRGKKNTMCGNTTALKTKLHLQSKRKKGAKNL
jgi:hypothetical protein